MPKKTILVLLMSLFAVVGTAYSDDPGCIFSGDGCFVIQDNKTITIPAFPGCSLTVSYELIDCPLIADQLRIVNIYFDEGNPGCMTMINCLWPFYPSKTIVNEGCAIDIYDDAFEVVVDLVAEDRVAIEGGYAEFECPDFKKIIRGYKTACSAICMSTYSQGPAGPGFYTWFQLAPCNQQYCCRTEKEYCWERVMVDGVPTWVKHESSSTQSTDDHPCLFSSPPPCQLAGVPIWWYVTECSDVCEEE